MVDRFSSIGKLLVAVLLVLSTTFALGQGIVSGTISGTVVDQQGAVVSGATVTAKDPTTNREFSTTSDDTGAFAVRSIPVGTYTVVISAPNFKKVQVGNVQVFANRITAMGSRALEVGGGEEVVDVEGTAPLVESTSSQVSTSFDSNKISNSPIGASTAFDALALQVPGMANAGDGGFSNTNGADLSSNGLRARSNNFTIDGQANNDASIGGPGFFVSNTDIIGEFQVVTNNFSAEYGRNSGSIVNYVTKSGTNSFHGSAFWFHENSSFYSLANDEKSPLFGFCEAGQDPNGPDGLPDTGDECGTPEKPKFRENRFGMTLGGPVITDKLWFFGSFQNFLQRGSGNPSQSGTSVTPTPAGIAALAAAFPGTPAVDFLQNFGPFAVGLGNPVATPEAAPRTVCNGANCIPVEFGSVTRFVPDRYDQRDWSGRLDWQVSDKDRVFGRYLFQNFNQPFATGRFAAGAFVDIPGSGQHFGLDWSRAWTSHFINQVRFNYSRFGFGFEGGSFPGCLQGAILECPTGISFAAAGTNLTIGMQNNLPQGRLLNNFNYQDNASWVVGRHTMKFGGEFFRQRSPGVFLPNINGTFTFRGSGTGSNCAAFPIPLGSMECGFSNFLSNTPSQLVLADGPPKFPFHEQNVYFYFQDDWRIKDNLTLNLGIRYEWFEQAINLLNEITEEREQDASTAFWDQSLPLENRIFPARPQDRNNWGPNIGFAWTPRIWEGLFGRDKTVFRGGYRIAYDPAYYNIHLNAATAAPVVNSGTVLGVGLPNGFPATGAGLQAAGYLAFIPRGGDPGFRNQTTVSPDFHNPYTQQWSFGMQRQITSKIAGEVRYAGNHAVGQFQTVNGNPSLRNLNFGTSLLDDFPGLVPAGLTPCADPAAPGFAEGRVDCSRNLVRLRNNGAWSIYHSMQSRLDVQNWHGFTGGAAYTWGKAIDNVSEIFSTGAGGNTVAGAMNPFDPNAGERGESGFSFRHIFNVHWMYELPWYKSQEGIMGHLLGGWSVNGIYSYQSGIPYTAAQGAFSTYCDFSWYASFLGIDTCRPILSSESAPLDKVGFCTDALAADCGLADWDQFLLNGTIVATTADAVHWIINDDTAAQFFGSPFLGVGRNTLRGQDRNNVDMGFYKNTKVNERLTVQFQANAFNIFNRQFRGTPDPFLDTGSAAAEGSFTSNLFNTSNRRSWIFGLRVIF